MGPCVVVVAVVGSTAAAAVSEAAYVERALAPALRPGQVVVILDNLGAHEGERARGLIEGGGREPPFLPPYSRRTPTRSRRWDGRHRTR